MRPPLAALPLILLQLSLASGALPDRCSDDQEQCTSLIQSGSRTHKAPFTGQGEVDSEEPPPPSQPSSAAGQRSAAPSPPAAATRAPLALPELATVAQSAVKHLHNVWTGAGGWLAAKAARLAADEGGGWESLFCLLALLLLVLLAVLCCLLPLPSQPRPAPVGGGKAGGGAYSSLASLRSLATVRAPPLQRFQGAPQPGPSVSSLGSPRRAEPMTATPPRSAAMLRDRTPPRSEAGLGGGESFLCPGLVVPSGCECTLRLPRLQPLATGQQEALVRDVQGQEVFRAAYSLPSVASSAAGRRCLVLTSTTQDATVFAFCRDSGAEALAVHTASGRPFGALKPCGQGRCELSTAGGLQLIISGGDDGGAMAEDKQGRALAALEVDATGLRTLRVGPLVDAGLLTLALLARELLEAALAAPRTPAAAATH